MFRFDPFGADGIELFEDFLKSEFSDENIQFWKACERFKTLPEHSLGKEAETMFEEYISPHAPKMVSQQLHKGIMINNHNNYIPP